MKSNVSNLNDHLKNDSINLLSEKINEKIKLKSIIIIKFYF